jgi:hypothetical protein
MLPETERAHRSNRRAGELSGAAFDGTLMHQHHNSSFAERQLRRFDNTTHVACMLLPPEALGLLAKLIALCVDLAGQRAGRGRR